jgi:hypothetical protein
VKSVVIENLNKDFGTELFVPFSITDIDMTYSGPIEFSCCGETKSVKSLYDCNLIGDYKTIWSILEKVQTYGNMLNEHITKEKIDGDYWYIKCADIVGSTGGQLCSSFQQGVLYENPKAYRHFPFGDYVFAYTTTLYHRTCDGIKDTPHYSLDSGGHLTNNIADNIYGSKQELENWTHFIFNNKLPLFLNIVLIIDQNNVSRKFIPWLVDKQYTDEEINTLFGFTDDEIKLMDDTLKKFERNSPWFKRYIYGRENQDESFMSDSDFEPVFTDSDYNVSSVDLDEIASMDEDILKEKYSVLHLCWESESKSGETDYSFRFWLKEHFEEQKRLAERIEDED